MKEDKTPLRERMIEDMRIRGLGAKTQQAHIRAVRYFAEFVGRSPDAATPDELRAYQLHMTDTGVSTGVFNASGPETRSSTRRVLPAKKWRIYGKVAYERPLPFAG